MSSYGIGVIEKRKLLLSATNKINIWSLDDGTLYKEITKMPIEGLIQQLVINPSDSHFACFSKSTSLVLLFRTKTFEYKEINLEQLQLPKDFGQI